MAVSESEADRSKVETMKGVANENAISWVRIRVDLLKNSCFPGFFQVLASE
jgi:hypothetical protein